MKATLKNICVALTLLAMVMVVLLAIDKVGGVEVSSAKTYVKVTVVDLDGQPVHNAEITVCGGSFFTDNKGVSPSIEIADPVNSYDAGIIEWYTVNVVAKKDGFVPSVAFNCVGYCGKTRKITVKMYPKDASDLPYVGYVENPPYDYVKTLLNK